MTATATIDSLVEQHVRTGLLRSKSPINLPGVEYASREILVGRVGAGRRKLNVFVELRLARRDVQMQTVTHEWVTGAWELSLSGHTVSTRSTRDTWESSGQIAQTVREIGTAQAVELAQLWQRWQLNTLTAGCAHQVGTKAPCPVTGYRYGHAWLLRELPSAVVARVLELLEQARDTGAL